MTAPAGFWPRYAAWSLDAAVVAAATTVLGAPLWSGYCEAMRRGWAAIGRRTAQIMADSALADLNFAGFFRRLLADPALHAALGEVGVAFGALLLGWLLAYAALGAVYEVACVAGPWRATPGKRALGLRVAAADGGRLGAGRAALRYLGGALSWLTLNIGHLVAVAKPEQRALHDRLAGARVDCIDARGMPAWAWAWIGLQLLAALAATAWLSLALQAALEAALDPGML
ncbi:RDD family protein [Lysobacter firmicutimachus]|uniref:RDD family protein n=1 Tax=Lysobacter firmicutimachus TaxID=1792846 RepID=A0AAU8MU00_9GAMM|nr:RDD family protein [Lysobacter antibioticus]